LDLTDEQTEDFKLLKKVLFEKAQKVNSSVVFSELLIWMYMQVDNFSGVYSQVVSVDLRSKANGQRLFDFAKTCTENKDYSTALRAFEEARLLTTNRELKFYSLEGILHVGYIQISDLKKHTDEELQKVLKNYEEALQSIGPITSRTLRVLLEYAELLAFYAEQKDKALEVIKEAYSAVSLTDMMRSELKMLQADIELLKGNVWEASLLYMQISEAFNFESIGNLAKFKSARIFYYEGEFEFAQSQLDVLKQSTSKLLSNDALELSIMITDNYGLDSNYIAMAWFSKADLYIEQLQFDKAFSLFDSIRTNYPFHSLADEILYKRARAMELQGNWQMALGFYGDIIKFHGTDILADNAIFKSAELMETKLGQSSEALKRYKQLLSDHPGSLYIHETRKRVRRLRGEKIEKEDEF
jgi:tetratricopeptide (TPR) repeat protein